MRFPAYLVLCSLLVGCGGGGGGGSSAPAPQPPGSSAANDSATVDEESSVVIDVTANDADIDTNSLQISSNPANGVAEVSGTEVVYTPAADFSGSDSFQYRVTGNDGVARTATVSVTVTDINDAPVASDDVFALVEDNTLPLTLGANDTDVDDGIAAFEIEGSFEGIVSGSGLDLTYQPPLDFVGEVAFQYRALDASGASSNLASVTVTVSPLTVTALMSEGASVPQSGYVVTNDSELGRSVLTSPQQQIEVPPNAVSLLLSLSGPDANLSENGLFISSLTPPSGPFPAFQRTVNFCKGGLCSSLVPRRPDYTVEAGTWTYTLGTLASNLDAIDFETLALSAAVRTGPKPDLAAARPAALNVKAFLTTASVSLTDIEAVLSQMLLLADANQLQVVVESIDEIAGSGFDVVSSSFLDSTTSELIKRGDPDAVNLFFVESFSDNESLVGVAGGIPGSFGVVDGFNGVLIDATIFQGGSQQVFVESTAETAFHEMGHLLGLYHTTEADFSAVDVIDDTPVCEAAVHDSNNNGTANPGECPDAANPMFWTNSVLLDWQLLTDDQKYVIYHSPIAVPGS